MLSDDVNNFDQHETVTSCLLRIGFFLDGVTFFRQFINTISRVIELRHLRWQNYLLQPLRGLQRKMEQSVLAVTLLLLLSQRQKTILRVL